MLRLLRIRDRRYIDLQAAAAGWDRHFHTWRHQRPAADHRICRPKALGHRPVHTRGVEQGQLVWTGTSILGVTSGLQLRLRVLSSKGSG